MLLLLLGEIEVKIPAWYVFHHNVDVDSVLRDVENFNYKRVAIRTQASIDLGALQEILFFDFCFLNNFHDVLFPLVVPSQFDYDHLPVLALVTREVLLQRYLAG